MNFINKIKDKYHNFISEHNINNSIAAWVYSVLFIIAFILSWLWNSQLTFILRLVCALFSGFFAPIYIIVIFLFGRWGQVYQTPLYKQKMQQGRQAHQFSQIKEPVKYTY